MASLSDYPRFTLGPELTAEQRNFFSRYGFLHFRPFANPEQVQHYLQANGFTRVFHVREGMAGSSAGPGWLKRGLPIDKP